MYEKVESCPCCNSSEFTNHIICDDHSISKESFAIMQCKNCSFLVTSPRPDKSTIGKYYQSEDYISHTNKGNSLTNVIYKIARSFTLKTKYKIVSHHSSKKTILDYGCGSGVLLKYFNDKGWKTFGVEPDDATRKKAIEELNLEIQSQASDLSKNSFSIITLWHVLEHVHEISTVLKQLHGMLSKNGKIIIAVPNHDSYDRQFYQKYWAAYDVPRHLYHFNQLTIKDLMKYHSFEFVESKPLYLDSYYVSLLSEKYKSGNNNYLKALIIGWLSNRWAKKNENNYSSLVYIFKKV